MHKYTYKYRGEVEIPPLSIVDDLLCISECGFKTTMSHAYLTLKTDKRNFSFDKKKVYNTTKRKLDLLDPVDLQNLKKATSRYLRQPVNRVARKN